MTLSETIPIPASCFKASRTSSALKATRSRTAKSATRRFQPRSIRRASVAAVMNAAGSSQVVCGREGHIDHGIGEEHDAEAEDREDRDARPLPAPAVEPEQQRIDDECQERPSDLGIPERPPESLCPSDADRERDNERGQPDRDARSIHLPDRLERREP